MLGRWRSWAVGAAGLLGAAAAWVLLPAPHGVAAALALGAGGAMAALVLGPSGVPAAHARAVGAGSALAGRDLAEALALVHPPVLVPSGPNLDRERLFLPSEASGKPLPTFDAQTLLYVAPPGVRFGVALEPPGLALVLQEEEATGVALPSADLGQVETFLSGVGTRSGLWSRLAITREAGTHRILHLPGPAAPCRDARARAACAAGFCPACSALCVGLVRALRRPLVLGRVEDEGDGLRLVLEEAQA